MQKVIHVDKDLVNDIQAKNIEFQVSQDVMLQLINIYNAHENTSFMQTPVFMAYKQQTAEKRYAWEEAKQNMFEKIVPNDIKNKVKSWKLDYFSEELTLEL